MRADRRRRGSGEASVSEPKVAVGFVIIFIPARCRLSRLAGILTGTGPVCRLSVRSASRHRLTARRTAEKHRDGTPLADKIAKSVASISRTQPDIRRRRHVRVRPVWEKRLPARVPSRAIAAFIAAK